MTPEAADFLAKAKRTIARADCVLRAGEPVDAARDAYIAALSAARAVVFERTGKSPKTRADYGVDDSISIDTATEAVALGHAFVRAVSGLLEQTQA